MALMPLFAPSRRNQAELLDAPNLPTAALHRNLAELDTINRLLGGHAATLRGLNLLTANWPTNRPLRVVDLGCGGGDALRAIYRWAARRGLEVHLTGVDLLPDAIDFARKALADVPNVTLLVADYRALLPSPGHTPAYDVAHASLFAHHLYGPQLEALVRGLAALGTRGGVVNDLHRHPLAYYSIMGLTAALSRSHLVRHDAPLSVWRGFTKAEWQANLRAWGMQGATVRWQWAFRHVVVLPHHPLMAEDHHRLSTLPHPIA